MREIRNTRVVFASESRFYIHIIINAIHSYIIIAGDESAAEIESSLPACVISRIRMEILRSVTWRALSYWPLFSLPP